MIFTIHTCSYVLGDVRPAPFHTGHCDARRDGLRYSPADGGNATLMDGNAVKLAHWESAHIPENVISSHFRPIRLYRYCIVRPQSWESCDWLGVIEPPSKVTAFIQDTAMLAAIRKCLEQENCRRKSMQTFIMSIRVPIPIHPMQEIFSELCRLRLHMWKGIYYSHIKIYADILNTVQNGIHALLLNEWWQLYLSQG